MTKIKLKKYVLGKETIIEMPNGEKRKAQYVIVSIDDIIASHDERTFESNKGYPIVNGENINAASCCSDKDIRAEIKLKAKDFIPSRIVSKSVTPFGTPIIDVNGIVLSGNKRVMSVKLAAKEHPKKYIEYDNYLREVTDLSYFGIHLEGSEFTDIEMPILVRIDYDFPMPYSPFEIAKYNYIVETPKTKQQEQVIGDIKKLNFTINADTLQEALKMAIPCLSIDILRPAMTGVQVELKPEGTYIIATNGHLLSVFFTPSVKNSESLLFIIHGSEANELLKKLTKNVKTVQFKYDTVKKYIAKNDKSKEEIETTFLKAVLNTGTSVEIPLVDARYPDWRTVVPVNNPFRFKFNRLEALAATKAIMLTANKTTNQIIYTFDTPLTTVFSKNLDYTMEGKTQLKVQNKNNDNKSLLIGFNGRLIAEILKSFKYQNFVWELSTPTRAGIIVPERPNDGNKSYYLTMPVMLTN